VTRRRILFALAGAGAGNAVRAGAIIDELGAERFEVALIVQGRSRDLAPASLRSYPLHDVVYGDGDFTGWNILRRNPLLPLRYLQNRRRCAQVVDDVEPDLVVVDSDVHSFPSARRRGIPVVSVNSSPATVALLRGLGAVPRELRFSYHCIERVDRWLQYRYADRIICPVIEPVEVDNPKVRQVGPIVRRQFREEGGATGSAGLSWDVGVMLGGSGIGVPELDLRAAPGRVVVLGNGSGGLFPPTAERIPFTAQPAAYLARSRVVVVQGGFNSVSEVLALRRPAVVVPIANHAEQHVNARSAMKLGATVSTGRQAGAAVRSLLDDYPARSAACARSTLVCDGATRAAALIEEMTGG
jgi:UDP:flavonoid glycosyltransferase YjiC (YdhE family)